MSSSRRKPDPVQEELVALRKRLAATDARVSALSMRGGLERPDDPEVIELRAANEGLRRAVLGSNHAPLRPMFRAPLLLKAIPGLADQFRAEVPASHILLPARAPGTADVRCRCDADQVVVLEEDGFGACACGRYFVMLDGAIYVARPRQDQTSVAAEDRTPDPGR